MKPFRPSRRRHPAKKPAPRPLPSLEALESRWLPSGTPLNPVQVLDDGDPGFSISGSWQVWTGGGYQNDVTEATGRSGSDVATWSFASLAPGQYRVSVTWTPWPDRATNAPYTVLADGAVAAGVAVNQQSAPAGFTDSGVAWQDLGVFQVQGGNLAVQLSDLANGNVIADGVRIEWVAPLAQGPQAQAFDGAAPVQANGSDSFGSTFLGTALTKTFTVKNQGTQDLVLGGPIGVPAGFSLAAGFGATTLAPGASTTFSVRLDASAAGNYSGQISFGTNDPSANPFTFSVSGTVSPVKILDDGDPGFDTVHSWLVWANAGGYQGDVREATAQTGADSASWTFANLLPGQYRVSATWTPWPNRATNAPYTVLSGGAALGSVLVNQQLVPADFNDAGVGWKDLGVYAVSGNDLVVRLTDSANGSVIADAVRIEWVAPVFRGPQVEVLDAGTAIPDGTGSDPFGSTPLGVGLTKTFTVENLGDQDLTLAGPIVVPAGFSVVAGFGSTTVAPGASTSFTIGLDGSVAGTFSGQVSFGSNDPSANPFTFAVSGHVTAPQAHVFDGATEVADNAGSVDFGTTAFGVGLTKTFTVENLGDQDLVLSTSILVPAGFSVVSGFGSTAVAPGASTTFSIGLDASVAGPFSGVVSFGTNDPSANPFDFTVSGRVTVPQAHVFDGAAEVADHTGGVGFGTTAFGAGLTKTFTVKNQGDQALTLSGPISVPAGFGLVSGFGATTLAPGASTTFVVRLNASAPGTYSGRVSFGTNDPYANPFTFTVSGIVSPVKVLDDGDPGFSTTGTWAVSAAGGYQADFRTAAPHGGKDSASWTFANLLPGRYRVSVTWVASPGAAKNAEYAVLAGTTSLGSVKVNQQVAPAGFTDAGGTWSDLGTFTVQGNTLVVRLSDAPKGYAVADAVRIEWLGPVPGAGANLLPGIDLPAGLQSALDRLLTALGQPGGGSQGALNNLLGQLNAVSHAAGVPVPVSVLPAGALDQLFSRWGQPAPQGAPVDWLGDLLRLLQGNRP
jgi:hypothetical protein